jgi:hypothetical protein
MWPLACDCAISRFRLRERPGVSAISCPEVGNWSTRVAQFGSLREILKIAPTLAWCGARRSRSGAAAESMIGRKP